MSGEGQKRTYIVSLVVELLVVFGNLGLLGVVPSRNGVVEVGLFSPLFCVDEPKIDVSVRAAVDADNAEELDDKKLTSAWQAQRRTRPHQQTHWPRVSDSRYLPSF